MLLALICTVQEAVWRQELEQIWWGTKKGKKASTSGTDHVSKQKIYPIKAELRDMCDSMK